VYVRGYGAEKYVAEGFDRKNGLVTAEKRAAVEVVVETGLSIIGACSQIGRGPASYQHQPKDWRKADSVVNDAINEVFAKVPRVGCWLCFTRMRSKLHGFNHQRVYRVQRRMGLNLPRRVKCKLSQRNPRPLEIQAAVNSQWTSDFTYDRLDCGKRFRALNVIDEGTWEGFEIKVDTSLPAERVIRVMEQL
jgi:putative transposase